MAHFNLYEALGLDREYTPEALRNALDEWIEQSDDPTSERTQNLAAARDVLGDPERRAKYDSVLDDPTAADLTPKDVHDLAALPTSSAASTAGSAQGGAPKHDNGMEAGKEKLTEMASTAKMFTTTQAKDAQQRFQKSDKKAIAITAVATAVVTLLLVGVFSALTSMGDSADEARDLAKEFVKLKDEDETKDWLKENTPAATRQDVINALGIGDSFAGVDAFLGTDEPQIGVVSTWKKGEHSLFPFGDEDYSSLSGTQAIFAEQFWESSDDLYAVSIEDENNNFAGILLIAVGDNGAELLDTAV
ncbi:hypothetical protein KRX51_08675 [Corynebacterium sp. TAE3-ERU12]|uniref:hypothetical protein n=1 Tax=Corynebacterium sp. TAE3-ERU12 TaxID=2849491 RepID=UPI001C43A0DB|nr:hypothetical protein [Corynebacterium sp. TAE3-ERU12]MBV7295982.1 hypothetical protein [Corynebacterium sp. TAE3-ERU12]